MNDSNPAPAGAASGSSASGKDERLRALFLHFVVQQSNMALVALGQVPHPHTGQATVELEAAQLLIDQLEMIEHKTRGNLGRDEERLLKQSLTSLRLAFVEALDHAQGAQAASADTSDPNPPQAAPAPASEETGPAAPSGSSDAESRKRFTKKY
jgi:hypothetical protein